MNERLHVIPIETFVLPVEGVVEIPEHPTAIDPF
jgi:hypothetical protein